MEEKIYWLGFSLFPGVGTVKFNKLLEKFGTARAAWEALPVELQSIVGEKLTPEFLAFRASIDLEKEYQKLVQKHIALITIEDETYPALLRSIGDTSPLTGDTVESTEPHSSLKPPFLLYVKGDISILSMPKTIGIVGTRKITAYGKQVTEMLTQSMVDQGFVTVSGLALGVDAVVHTATIAAQGKTIAVLGCGVDCCTPTTNQKIYDEILAIGGAIVSTFPPGMQATIGSFPARNALIAGLSRGILVTEGAADSGSLITANYAKKYGRPLFAVPGPITSSLSSGANSLIQQGAIATVHARDILDKLDIMGAVNVDGGRLKVGKENLSSAVYLQLSRKEQEVAQLLQLGPLHFDEIVRTIGADSKTIGSLLSLMELKGVIQNDTGAFTLR